VVRESTCALGDLCPRVAPVSEDEAVGIRT